MHKEVKEKRAPECYIILQPTLMMLNITSKVLVFSLHFCLDKHSFHIHLTFLQAISVFAPSKFLNP